MWVNVYRLGPKIDGPTIPAQQPAHWYESEKSFGVFGSVRPERKLLQKSCDLEVNGTRFPYNNAG